ncbi:MAG TPA: hypothetical protein VIV60_07885, partial [Polyangiaceae bacterium]
MNMIEGEQKTDQQEAAEPSVNDPASATGEGAQSQGQAPGQRRSRRRSRPSGDERNDYRGDERANLALEFVTMVIDDMDMDCRVRLRRPRQE